MVSLLNSIAEIWAANFGLLVLQNTLFLGLIFTALYFLKNTHAAFKYMMVLLGTIKLLLPPFVPGQVSWFTTGSTSTMTIGEITGIIAFPAGEQVTIKPSIALIILLIWIITVAGYLLLSLFSTAALKAKLRHAQKLDIVADVPIYISDKISSPLSIGIWPKHIYVPAWWHSLPQSSQTSLLNHELAHIRRHDGLTQFFQTLAQAVYFFHPMVWLLNERMNEYREMACDDLAVESTQVSPNKYSQDLYKVAQKTTGPQWSYISSSALIKHKYKLLNRVSYQLQEEAMLKNKTKIRLVFILLAFMILPLSWYCSQEETPALGINNNSAINQETGAETGKIWGKVTDRETGGPVAGVNITIENTNIGSVTDNEGMFYISNLKSGEYTLKFLRMGYGSVIFEKVAVEPQKSTQLDCRMTTQTIDMTSNETPPPPPPVPDGDQDIFVAYDTPPAPVGGFAAVQKELVYPEIARKAGIEGRVELRCLIDKTGNITETEITKSLGNNGCDEAAIKAIKAVKWQPATQRGKAISVWIAIPVSFSLQ